MTIAVITIQIGTPGVGCRLKPIMSNLDRVEGMAMRMRMFLIVAAIGGFAMVGAQGCFYYSNGPDQYGQQYGSGRTVCDANGNNCMVCDADNRNCQRVDSQYGPSQRRNWGFWF